MKMAVQYPIYPEEYWGLDPLFRTPVKLYIKHVLEMPESPAAGVFLFKNHPIVKVDIQGTVVSIIEKTKFTSYGVDDSTGVINCCCWNNADDITDLDTSDPLSNILRDSLRDIPGISNVKLGDTLNVKGKLKVFRDRREISSSDSQCYKVLSFDEEITRMLELPLLYKDVYHVPFRLPERVKEDWEQMQLEGETGVKSNQTLAKEISVAVKWHISQGPVKYLHIDDIHNIGAIKQILEMVETSADETSHTNNLVEKAISLLEEEGLLFKMGGQRATSMQVTDNCSDLGVTIIETLRRQCSKPRYEETGLHFLRILDELHKTVTYNKLTLHALKRCLSKLEDNSDIIRVTETHYVAYT